MLDGVFIDFKLVQRRFFYKFRYFQLNHLLAVCAGPFRIFSKVKSCICPKKDGINIGNFL
jgi:hypothetical protein